MAPERKEPSFAHSVALLATALGLSFSDAQAQSAFDTLHRNLGRTPTTTSDTANFKAEQSEETQSVSVHGWSHEAKKTIVGPASSQQGKVPQPGSSSSSSGSVPYQVNVLKIPGPPAPPGGLPN